MTLDEAINSYGEAKALESKCKKTIETLGEQIKSAMRELGDDYSTESYKAKFSSYERTSLNEDAAIALLQGTSVASKVLKTKVYVDTDVLEDLMYHGRLPMDLMQKLNDCISSKTVEAIRVTPIKKKGGK